jgi:Tfp pilus assembly protein PilP
MKRKNIIVPVLIIVSLIVWSRNIYLIIVGLTQNDEEVIEQNIEPVWEFPDSLSSFSDTKEVFIYSAKFRDPFKHWLYQPKKKKSVVPVKRIKPEKIEKQAPKPPKLRFSGVLEDETGILAIIEGPDGTIYFAKGNDIIEGVHILKVKKDSIQYEFGKQKFWLELKQ